MSADLLSACGASAGAHPKQDDLSLLLGGGPIQTTSTLPPSSNQKNDLLADLFGGIGLGSAAPVMATSNNIGTTQNALGDLFGGPSLLTTTAVQPSSSVATNNAFSDLFGGGDLLSSSAPPPAAAAKNYTCYSNNGLLISMTPNLANGLSNVDITSKFTNSGSSPIIGLNFQVAVPKSLKLQMLPPSNTTVAPGLTETQTMKIENPTKVSFANYDY